MPSSAEPGRYRRIVQAITETPWAITEAAMKAMCEVVALRVEGVVLSREEISERISSGPGSRDPYGEGAVAVVPIYGLIAPRANLMTEISGGTSLQRLWAALDQAAADPAVASILLDVNSPGGSIDLLPETAAKIRAARQRKRVVAVANTTAASAAYWLASQADELVVTPSGSVGSIGVLAAHDDLSAAQEKAGVRTTLISAGRYKTEGNPYEPLGEEARAALQAMVDDFYAMFVADVARGRGVDRSAVRSGFGEGRMVLARQAVEAGMADRVDTFESTLARLARGRRSRSSASALDEPEPGVAAAEPAEAELAPSEPDRPDHDEREAELLAQIRDQITRTTTRLEEARS